MEIRLRSDPHCYVMFPKDDKHQIFICELCPWGKNVILKYENVGSLIKQKF